VLQFVATRLQQCVRQSDTVSRHGGDEFVVLLSEVEDTDGATLIAEKVLEAMVGPHLVAGHRLRVTLSIGISLHPDHGEDIDAVLRNADTAMYHAKKIGRCNYQVFAPDMRLTDADSEAVTVPMHAVPR
jgi:diguanylate cyclase (GGDEF)-like protein